MSRLRRSTVLVGLAAALVTLVGCSRTPAAVRPLSIKIWGVAETNGEFNPLIGRLTKNHPNVAVTYEQRPAETYELDLLAALAAGTGPDIFAVPAGSLRHWVPYLQPAPPQFQLPITKLKRQLFSTKEVKVVQTFSGLTARQVGRQFVGTVGADSLIGGQLYGLPLAVDTLVLAYNQTMLDAARLPQPPEDWTSFQSYVIQLTARSEGGRFRQSGAALGTGRNVANATDLLALIMTQNGTVFLPGEAPNFSAVTRDGEETRTPAGEALRFYTDFANPTRESYTWNLNQAESTEALSSGQVAMAFLTPAEVAELRARAGSVNINVATVPQLDGSATPVAAASYWLYGVAKQSPEGSRAWGVLQRMLTDEDGLAEVLKSRKRGPSTRALVDRFLRDEDADLSVVANQALVARTWYHGLNQSTAEQATVQVIDDVVAGDLSIENALKELTRLVGVTYQKP